MPVRPSALAGTWYAGDPRALNADVERFLAGAAPPADGAPKAIITPHAGLAFSGPIAGSAYAQLLPARDTVERIVLLGPAHRAFVRGLCAPTVDGFETPLGVVRIDRAALDSLRDLPQVSFADGPHAEEHSLEIQLPFLQRLLGDFSLVPLLVGAAQPAEVAEVLERLWGGPETRIVISSDLSHFHDYATAQRLDRATSEAIERLDVHGLDEESACGRVPIRGLLAVARRKGLAARTLDLRNSGDTSGRKDRVVGYGAYAFDD
jgi:AmmeMemoRadiSam system protein B